jgi:hypothetical protein
VTVLLDYYSKPAVLFKIALIGLTRKKKAASLKIAGWFFVNELCRSGELPGAVI